LPDHRDGPGGDPADDILSKRIGAIDVRWKTHSIQTGIDIVRKHLPEMVIVGLGQNPTS